MAPSPRCMARPTVTAVVRVSWRTGSRDGEQTYTTIQNRGRPYNVFGTDVRSIKDGNCSLVQPSLCLNENCKKPVLCKGLCVNHYAAMRYALNPEPYRERSRAYQQSHREENMVRSKQWRIENPEQFKTTKQASYLKNKDYYAQKHQQYYQSNTEQVRLVSRQWALNHPDQVRDIKRRYKHRRRDWEKGLPISQCAYDRLLIRYENRCAYCSVDLKITGLHWDHVTPLSRGGRNAEGNVVPACPPCNLSKSASTVMEWRLRGGFSDRLKSSNTRRF